MGIIRTLKILALLFMLACVAQVSNAQTPYSQELVDKAEAGDAESQNALGVCYVNGDGVSKDIQEAVKWFTKSAKQGNMLAQDNLGQCYEEGWGVERNHTEAMKWFTKAAEQGNASSQYNLGFFYYNGTGVPKNYREAVKWYTKAAEQGFAPAQNNLGVCYFYGQGVTLDLNKAIFWILKAAEQGDAKSIEILRELFGQDFINNIEKVEEAEEVEDDRIYDVPEESAEFPGDVNDWLDKNIDYPIECKKKGVQGRVTVQFVINKDGSLTDVTILRSPDDNLSKEAERVVKSMPKWQPARQRGKAVRMLYVLPVMFRIKE